jgi:hypothetical protein
VDRARQEGLSAEQVRMLLEVALDEPAADQADRADQADQADQAGRGAAEDGAA